MKSQQKELLASYRKKRNFDQTPEPKGTRQFARKKPIFVVQQHDASHMHYDFRLEIKGVLKSWAIPKGPSINPQEKRLAVLTEDHPLEYADFEGIIPEGQYGAGKVIIWDKGTYQNLLDEKDNQKPTTMDTAFKQGKIEINLRGKKLKGNYVLIRTQRQAAKGDRQWLLIKMKDAEADTRVNITKSQPESVKSGRTIREIGK